MLKLWMIAIKYTAIHTGPLKSDLPEQNHFIFISFCSILWKPNQKRIIKIESSCAYFLHCQCPNHHSGVFIPKNNSEGPICKWFSTWWFLEMASKLLSSKEVIYRMNHRNTMFKVIEQIAQQFSSNHKSKAYQRLIYFVVFTFEVYGWIRKIWYVYTMVHFKKQKWRSKCSHMQENSRSGNYHTKLNNAIS